MHAAELELLLSEDAWMRRLAAGLAGNAGEGDDLVQEVWSAALEGGQRPPRELRSPRAWLGAVLRKLQLQSRRGRSRRAQRERAVARAEAQPGADELVEQLSLRKEIAVALLALDEPYRGALYLRFYQDCELKELAARQGVPVSTAHARVQRGLELLRARLDREHGGERSAWVLALATLAKPPGFALKVGIGGVLMGTAIKVAASVLVLAGLAWVVHEAGSRAPESESVVAGSPSERGPEEAVLQATSETARREAADPSGLERSIVAGSAKAAATVSGHVLGLDRAPLSGIELGLFEADWGKEIGDNRQVSGADGSFRFTLSSSETARQTPVALDPRRATLQREEHDGEWLLVLSGTAAYAGHVVERSGAPIAGADVTVDIRQAFFRELGVLRPYEFHPESWSTKSDASGSFSLAQVPAGPAAALFVRASGFVPATVALPAPGAADLVAVLEPASGAIPLAGFVFDPDGRPVPGARVSTGTEIVTSREDGAFDVLWRPDEGSSVSFPNGGLLDRDCTHIAAVKQGFGPVREELARLDTTVPIELRLHESLRITGRVVDARGQRRAGIVVWPLDATILGLERDGAGESAGLTPVEIESLFRGGSGVVTTEGGAFALDGLLPRSYSLVAYDPHTLETGGPWEVESGAVDIDLVLAPGIATARVAGTIVSTAGVPLSGASVQPVRVLSGDAHWNPPIPEEAQNQVLTDEQGRFEFPELVVHGSSLVIFHESTFMQRIELDAFADAAQLSIVVPVLCTLQIDTGGRPDLATNARILDADEHELGAVSYKGMQVTMTPYIRIQDGKSDVVRVPETARTLILRRDGQEVLRVPFRPDPDRLTIVRP